MEIRDAVCHSNPMLHTALLLLLAPPPMVGDLKANFDSEMKKAIALAEAIPEEKYGYRPAANVRTTGEVLVHIANGNREFLSAIKGASRDEMMALFKDQEQKEKNLKGKAAIIAEMKASWEEVTKALDAESEESLKKPVSTFGPKATVQGVWIGSVAHVAEHLGQLIAYARASGIKPPWSE
jgi:uncharacterized damage-inducible protein DinB